MYRKRKEIAPSFRMPNPRNPVSGNNSQLYGPFRLYARFTLTEALDGSTESAEATITTPDQWGPGLHHCPDVVQHVHNLLGSDETTYIYSGGVGDVGIALWDHNNHWRIVGMLTSTLVECCLQEDHPGRGTAFNVKVGSWSPDDDKWVYNDATTYKAIDWRNGMPYPDAGGKGLFTPHPSTTHGIIYDCVSLDCTSPGTCDD